MQARRHQGCPPRRTTHPLRLPHLPHPVSQSPSRKPCMANVRHAAQATALLVRAFHAYCCVHKGSPMPSASPSPVPDNTSSTAAPSPTPSELASKHTFLHAKICLQQLPWQWCAGIALGSAAPDAGKLVRNRTCKRSCMHASLTCKQPYILLHSALPHVTRSIIAALQARPHLGAPPVRRHRLTTHPQRHHHHPTTLFPHQCQARPPPPRRCQQARLVSSQSGSCHARCALSSTCACTQKFAPRCRGLREGDMATTQACLMRSLSTAQASLLVRQRRCRGYLTDPMHASALQARPCHQAHPHPQLRPRPHWR